MDIVTLIRQSENIQDIDYTKIPCVDNGEQLAAVQSDGRLTVLPIWVDQVDKLEGPLYANYIKSNSNYNAVFARSTVARKLHAVADSLPERYKLIVRAAHRPQEVQIALLQLVVREHKIKNPEVSDEAALEYARIFVSDPAIKLPPHCCGAAVDVDVLDQQTGRLVDFGCPVNTDGPQAFLHSSDIHPQQTAHRTMLLTAMLRAGFASYYAEWWHYSYGDQLWAYFYSQKNALYGIIEPDI